MATGEKLDDFVKLGGVVNDVITGNKLQEPTCYHIVLYSRHNKLAEKHNEPLPPRLVMMTLSGSYTKSYHIFSTETFFVCLLALGGFMVICLTSSKDSA